MKSVKKTVSKTKKSGPWKAQIVNSLWEDTGQPEFRPSPALTQGSNDTSGSDAQTGLDSEEAIPNWSCSDSVPVLWVKAITAS